MPSCRYSSPLKVAHRYSPTESFGVHATEGIIIRKFGWIFEEQPIVIARTDALIEESVNGNPTEKFIALLIKSGQGNFSVFSDKLTCHISNIRCNYWLNFDIPVLLIAHIPETNQTYRIKISRGDSKKTKERWKIEMPTRNLVNVKAKKNNRITK